MNTPKNISPFCNKADQNISCNFMPKTGFKLSILGMGIQVSCTSFTPVYSRLLSNVLKKVVMVLGEVYHKPINNFFTVFLFLVNIYICRHELNLLTKLERMQNCFQTCDISDRFWDNFWGLHGVMYNVCENMTTD